MVEKKILTNLVRETEEEEPETEEEGEEEI
jgi:hypothetical protein